VGPVTPGPTASGDGPRPSVASGPLRYVALGDSYTIGTSVAEPDRWPNQLVAVVPGLELVANLGVNGFTTGDLIDVELPQLPGLRPQMVSVLIGVNDVVQGMSASTYRDNVLHILGRLRELVPANRILVVTTPDYTVTPAGADYGDPRTQSAGIRERNQLITQLAAAQGIAVVDIYDISLRAAEDRSLVAGDGLHPSGRQYALWVDRIAPAIEGMLGE
jgi:lysophospholipase L1-like esterase